MKIKNMKRFGSVIMAGALALSLAVPAFADKTVTIDGGYEAIPISVSVPTSGTAQINPYGLPVDFTLSDTITKVNVSGQQITSAPLSIRNQGVTKLAVNATLAVDTSGTDNSVEVVKADLTTQKGKEINLALQVAGLSDNKYAVSSLDTTLEDNIIKAFADTATWANANSLKAENTASGTALADAAVAKSASALAVLGAASEGAGGLITYGKDSIAVFRLTGKLNESPVKAGASAGDPDVDDPWTTNDKFSATVVFKFKPAKAATLGLDKTNLALTAVTPGTTNKGTVKATLTAGDAGESVASWKWTSDPATDITLANDTTDTVTVTATSTSLPANYTLTCTATLDNGETVTATCTVVLTAT